MLYLEMIESPADKIKFEQLYLKYRDYMLHIAKKYLNNAQDAEDAVHNAFLSIAKNIEKIGDPASLKTKGYISIITERKAIDLYRETHGYIVITIERKAIDIIRDHNKHEAEELVEDEICFVESIPCENRLQWCILQLPPRYREVILLKYSHGYRIQEIAEILNISFAAASKLNQRAKAKLKELYEKEKGGDI